MDLFDRFVVDDDEVVVRGLEKDFGKIFNILGAFKSFNKRNISATICYYALIFLGVFGLIVMFSCTAILSIAHLPEVMTMGHFILILNLAIILLYSITVRRGVITRFYRIYYYDFKAFVYDYDPGLDEIKNGQKKYLKLIKRFVGPVIFLGGFAVIALGPIVDLILGEEVEKIDSINYNTPVPMYWPKFGSYFMDALLPFVFQSTATVSTACIITAGDTIYFHMCLCIYEQLKVLIHNIRSLESHAMRSVKMETTDKKEYVLSSSTCTKHLNQYIKNIVQLHNNIIVCFDLVSAYAGWAFFSVFVSGGAIIAIALVYAFLIKTRMGNLITAIYICTSGTLIFGIVTFIADNLTQLCMEIHEEIYNIRWYLMKEEVKKSVLIISNNSLRPYTFKTSSGTPVDKAMFSAILQAAYSFINLVVAAK